LGIGPNPQSPIPNPQSPIPNPQNIFTKIYYLRFKNFIFLKKALKNVKIAFFKKKW